MSVEATTAAWAWPGLTPTEKLVLVRIGDHASPDGTNAYPGLDRLSTDTGLSRRAIQNAVRTLEQKGALTVQYKAGPGGTNRYTVTLDPPADPSNVAPPAPCTSDTVHDVHGAPPAPDLAPRAPSEPPDLAPGAPDLASDDTRPGTSCTQTIKNHPEPKDMATGSAVAESDPFDRFWAAWPPGRKLKRPDALRAFTAAAKRTDPEQLIAAAEAWATAWTQLGTELRFIPHPATWLRAEQWNDPLPAPAGHTPNGTTGPRLDEYQPEPHHADPDLNLAGLRAAREIARAGAAS